MVWVEVRRREVVVWVEVGGREVEGGGKGVGARVCARWDGVVAGWVGGRLGERGGC